MRPLDAPRGKFFVAKPSILPYNFVFNFNFLNSSFTDPKFTLGALRPRTLPNAKIWTHSQVLAYT